MGRGSKRSSKMHEDYVGIVMSIHSPKAVVLQGVVELCHFSSTDLMAIQLSVLMQACVPMQRTKPLNLGVSDPKPYHIIKHH